MAILLNIKKKKRRKSCILCNDLIYITMPEKVCKQTNVPAIWRSMNRYQLTFNCAIGAGVKTGTIASDHIVHYVTGGIVQATCGRTNHGCNGRYIRYSVYIIRQNCENNIILFLKYIEVIFYATVIL